MMENTTKKCEYNSAKVCDGLCNNCPRYYFESIELEKKLGIYIPDYTIAKSRQSTDYGNDYEGAILARQEYDD